MKCATLNKHVWPFNQETKKNALQMFHEVFANEHSLRIVKKQCHAFLTVVIDVRLSPQHTNLLFVLTSVIV